MVESATLSRSGTRRDTTVEIIAAAQRLTDERGLDGFTMDDLADEVGVSRRTLFNHVPGKIDAVLGPDLTVDAPAFEVFASGGPTGKLLDDVRTLCVGLLGMYDTDPDEVTRAQNRFRSEPRLIEALRLRLERLIDRTTDAIVDREGAAFGPDRARVLAGLMLSVFAMAAEDFIDDSTAPLADHFARIFDTAVDVFR